MAQKISVQIALEGGAEIERQLAGIGEAGQKAFADIAKAAEQAGGFKQLDPGAATAAFEKFGVTGADAINKIQAAVAAAARLESVVQGVQSVEAAFVTLGEAAGPVGLAIAAAIGAATKATIAFAEAVSKADAEAIKLGLGVEQFDKLRQGFEQAGISAGAIGKGIANFSSELDKINLDRVQQAFDRVSKSSLGGAVEDLKILRDAADGIGPAADAARAALEKLSFFKPSDNVTLAFQSMVSSAGSATAAIPRIAGELSKLGTAGERARFVTLALQEIAATAGSVPAAIENVIAAMQQLPDSIERNNAILKIFGDQLGTELIQALRTGGLALDQFKQKMAGALTPADANKANLLTEAINRFYAALARLGSVQFAPILTAGINAITAAIQFLGAAVERNPLGTLIAAWFPLPTLVAGIATEIARLASALTGITWESISGAGVAAWNAIVSAVQTAGQTISDFVSNIPSIAWDALATAGVAAWNAITAAIQAAIDKVKEFLGLKPSAPAPAPAGATPAPAGFARGGLIGGRGSGRSDSNLAWVSRGEHIMPAAAVAQPGVLAFLEAIRRTGGSLPGFAGGGIVGGDGESLSVHDVIKLVGDTVKQMKEDIAKLAEVLNYVMDQGTSRVDKLLQALDEAFTQITGQARGGLLGGRGTGTSDSNLAWVSRGEHIMPARAVAQPGVLAFLEALRLSGGNLSRVLDGMGRFALGGLVRGPLPAFAGGGMVGTRDLGTLTLRLSDGTTVSGLTDARIAEALGRHAALGQVRSGGRKPSRYS